MFLRFILITMNNTNCFEQNTQINELDMILLKSLCTEDLLKDFDEIIDIMNTQVEFDEQSPNDTQFEDTKLESSFDLNLFSIPVDLMCHENIHDSSPVHYELNSQTNSDHYSTTYTSFMCNNSDNQVEYTGAVDNTLREPFSWDDLNCEHCLYVSSETTVDGIKALHPTIPWTKSLTYVIKRLLLFECKIFDIKYTLYITPFSLRPCTNIARTQRLFVIFKCKSLGCQTVMAYTLETLRSKKYQIIHCSWCRYHNEILSGKKFPSGFFPRRTPNELIITSRCRKNSDIINRVN